MNLKFFGHLSLFVLLLAIVIPGECAQRICLACGRPGCPIGPFASADGSVPPKTLSGNELTRRTKDIFDRLLEDEQKRLGGRRPSQEEIVRISAKLQEDTQSELAKDPEFGKLRAKEFEEKEVQLAAARQTPTTPLSPDEFRKKLANVIDQNPQIKGYSEAQRNLFSSAAYGQLLFAAKVSKNIGAGSSDYSARALATIAFEENHGSPGSEKFSSAVQLYADEVKKTAQMAKESQDRLNSVRDAAPSPTQRAKLMKLDSSQPVQPEMQTTLAKATAIALKLKKDCSDRQRGLRIIDVPLPKATKDDQQAESSARKWAEDTAKEFKNAVGRVIDHYPK